MEPNPAPQSAFLLHLGRALREIERRIVVTGKGVYSRRLSSEEAREGYILVSKNKLSSFPVMGTSFELAKQGRSRKVKVESYPCACRGPDLPHEHYFIRWKGLKQKQRVEIQEDPRKDGRYLIRIRD